MSRKQFVMAIALLLIIAILSLMALGQIYPARQTISKVDRSQQLQKLNAARGDCVRQVQADSEQYWRQHVSKLLVALSNDNKPQIADELERLVGQPNYADTVKTVCPPSIAGAQ